METSNKTIVHIETQVNASLEKTWQNWTSTHAITKWHTASPDWHTPQAEHVLEPGGKFSYRMEAKDGSFGFDFSGTFDTIRPNEFLGITLDDGRKMTVTFSGNEEQTQIKEAFEAEETNPVEMQRGGWQNILDNFKTYVESLNERVQLHFKTTIHATAEKVYETLTDTEKYKLWASAFFPGCYFEGSWEKGSKIHFLGVDENGEKGGMLALVAENIPGQLISLIYQGIIKGEEEITEGKEVEDWKGGFENYTLKEKDGVTELTVDISAIREFQDFFSESWPLALTEIKKLAEQ